jgi:hypothetical protein
MAYHRAATTILTLALALAVPATTTAQLPDKLTSPASSSPCSEVCSGGGYFGKSNTTRTADSLPTILNGASHPGPCSEVCSGGGYGSASQPSPTPDDPGPCSEVCSGGGYGSASQPSWAALAGIPAKVQHRRITDHATDLKIS